MSRKNKLKKSIIRIRNKKEKETEYNISRYKDKNNSDNNERNELIKCDKDGKSSNFNEKFTAIDDIK